MESVCPKTCSDTHFRPPNGLGTKKKPTKDEVRVRVKQKILLSGRYLHLKMIPKGVLGHTEIPRGINK